MFLNKNISKLVSFGNIFFLNTEEKYFGPYLVV